MDRKKVTSGERSSASNKGLISVRLMNVMKFRTIVSALILTALPLVVSQNSAAQNTTQKNAPSKQQPAAKQPSASPADSANTQKPADAAKPSEPGKVDRAASYYHFSLAHMYEEMMAMYGRSEYATKAIEEYRLAIDNDPSSDFLNSGLAELYYRTGRIRDAVQEAQDMIKRDPNNLPAHKLLGRIYRRSLGDTQAGAQSREILTLAIGEYEALARIEPKSSDNHLMLGQLYILNKDLTKAETEFKTAMSLDPTSEEAVTNLAYLYNEEGDNGKAAATLNAIPESRRTSRIYGSLGYTYEQQKDYKNAIAAFRQAVKMDKDNLDAMRGLAQNLANDNQMDAALDEFKAVQEADPQDATASLRISEIYRRMGKLDLAMQNLKKAESLVQDSLEVSYNEAIILEGQGKYDEAAQVLQKLLTRTAQADGNYTQRDRNNRALFLERLGNIYREENRPLLALETFRKMVDLGGDESSRGYQEIIDTYRDQKQWPEATKTAQEAVKKLPKDKNLKMALAVQLADDGKVDEAVAMAKATLKGDANGSEDREGYLQLEQLYARLRRWKEAEEALAQADKLSSRGDEKEAVQFAYGALYERQKKYEQAEQSFRQVLQINPSNGMALNYLGYMLADRNVHLEEALTLIKEAVDLDPQNGAYLDSLGWAYFRLGNYDQAEENLRRAADKTPADATVQDHIAELYSKTGKLKLAVMHWERALAEWNRSVPADVEQQDVARVQKKLESTKVKLAQQAPKQ